MADFIEIQGLDARRKELEQLVTSNPAMKKYLQGIIRKCIGEARKNVVKDAQGVLDNDPRHAYKAVRNSVYKQIFGGQINILSSRKRGAPTRYQRPRKLDENPHKRGGNRRKRSLRTLQLNSYEGVDRGFVLRFQNAGTVDRDTRYGNRGSLRARHWFGVSSAYQMDAAATKIAVMIEQMLDSEFKLQ